MKGFHVLGRTQAGALGVWLSIRRTFLCPGEQAQLLSQCLPSVNSSHHPGDSSPFSIPTEVPSSSGLTPDIPLEPEEPDCTFLGLENCLWFKLSTVNLSPDTVAKSLSFPGPQHCVCFHTHLQIALSSHPGECLWVLGGP